MSARDAAGCWCTEVTPAHRINWIAELEKNVAHVDGTLVMGYHAAEEVGFERITAVLYRHLVVHPGIGTRKTE